MGSEVAIKTGIASLGTVLVFYSENFTTVFVWLLILFEVADYLTGIIAAYRKNELCSKFAFWGFIKKLCYFVLIGVAFGVDYIIDEAVFNLGLDINTPAIFGILSVGYLISTEAISILENLAEMGIEVPFLSKAIKKMRDKISEKGDDGI